MTSAQSKAAAAPLRSRILAIDYGRRRMGLAISDEMRLTVRPLQTLARTNRRNDLRRLREIARENSVGLLVVGHPLSMDGSAGAMAEEVARFAARLGRELGLPVELADERLSSWEAEQMAAVGGPSRSKERSTDEVAAAIILRDYLERQRAAGEGKPGASDRAPAGS
jgi:putative Holliday junction resolvase